MHDGTEQILLTPINGCDPDDMPTQRIRIDDMEAHDRAMLLDSIRRLDEVDAALDAEITLDDAEEPEIAARPASLAPSSLRLQSTPAVAFGVGFGCTALAQLAWWMVA